MTDFDVTLESRGDVTVAHVAGRVCIGTADRFLTVLERTIGDGHVHLVGDFSRVVYTSQTGLRSLQAAMRGARRRGGDLRLAAVPDRVHKVLRLSGFTRVVDLYPDVDAAVASFSPTA